MPLHQREKAHLGNSGRIPSHLGIVLAAFLLSLCFVPRGAVATPGAKQCDAKTYSVPLPDPVSGRRYQLFVSLPQGFDPASPALRPVLFLADGGRAFPRHICEIRDLTEADKRDLVVVGLGYADGESLEDSRRRDYTPTAQPSTGHVYGGSTAYQAYIKDVVIPFAEAHYRTDPARRIFWGHSYGGLLATTILLRDPGIFQTYIIGSPSLWYGSHVILEMEKQFAAGHHSLPANVFLYVGGKEVSRYEAGRHGFTKDMVEDAKTFEQLLRSRSYEGLTTKFMVIPDKDHVTSVGPGITWGLRLAFQPGS
ncbi:alpha/beta hydrolase [Rhizobium lusitanum]|uniref:Alpha/beta hydrolase n=1 Tax=Rhizobium lusitanum TaxID=293958 RepID=A0A7X0MFA1_9HYPH|nr:alpha/beta hydrolase-fold protein [Rhizobium lusitanum]MBB6486818.1 hypothetical protein [Rhizobium lusitanum]